MKYVLNLGHEEVVSPTEKKWVSEGFFSHFDNMGRNVIVLTADDAYRYDSPPHSLPEGDERLRPYRIQQVER